MDIDGSPRDGGDAQLFLFDCSALLGPFRIASYSCCICSALDFLRATVASSCSDK